MTRVLVVSHDAGGAEVLSSWLKGIVHYPPQSRIHYLLDGPAKEIFSRKLGVGSQTSIDVASYDEIVTGTSGAANLERDVVREAREKGVYVTTWLDHWKNYPQRVHVAPDQFWVSDEHAERLAQLTWPTAKVARFANPYLEEIADEIAVLDDLREAPGKPQVLYVEEPGYEWNGKPCGSRFANPFLDRVSSLAGAGASILIRPHPSTAEARFPLAKDVSWSDTVIGFDSMALVVALNAGRRVISLLPEGSIPYEGIERPFSF
jgi:hypothetical protein